MIRYSTNVNGIQVQASYDEKTVSEILLPFLKHIERLQSEKNRRILVMLAAPPGAGKTTLLSFLESLAGDNGIAIQTIGMDGFHRRQEYLLEHCAEIAGEQIPMVRIKGAPVTFDLEKLTEAVKKVASGEVCGWPAYDRLLHNPVEDAVTVDGNIVLLEGNYLLLDEDGWRELSSFADYTVSIRADEGMLRGRLIERKIKTGLDREAAEKFVDFSDIPNVRLCLERTMPADLELVIQGNSFIRKTRPYDAGKWLAQIENVIREGPYSDTWESLSSHETPRWFRDAKFGIFVHWGVYSVPAFDNEWYPRSMYIQGSRAFRHHVETYGPQARFGYKDLIPAFRAEHFDPAEWAALFKRAGARYVIPVAEHHDGFQMYDSALSDWNASKMGPCRDITGELTEAVRREGMINGASTHRIEHWFFMNHGREFDSDVKELADQRDHLYWPAMPVPDEAILGDPDAEPAPSREFLEDWMIRTVEIIDRFHPKQIYFDWWILHRAARPYLRKIAAYYFNRAASWGEEVMLVSKMGGFAYGTAVRDTERGQLRTAQPEPWQTDTSTARNSWCYTVENRYKSAVGILRDLMDAVAKNGCMLLNVGPKADGTFAEEDVRILTEIGDWLRINGEAVYGSRPFMISDEGPARPPAGSFSDGEDTEYTSRDIRYTVNRGNIYATALRGDSEGHYVMEALANRGRENSQATANIIVEKTEAPDPRVRVLSWKQTERGLEIHTDGEDTELPVTFRITQA